MESIRTKEYGYDDVVRKLKKYIPERQKALGNENAIVLKLRQKAEGKAEGRKAGKKVNIASQKDEKDKGILRPNAGQSNVKRQK